jgi:hypothetical protein
LILKSLIVTPTSFMVTQSTEQMITQEQRMGEIILSTSLADAKLPKYLGDADTGDGLLVPELEKKE